MAVLALVIFIFILLNGTLGFNPLTDAHQQASKITDEIDPGATQLRRGQGQLNWVSHLNAEQLTELAGYAATEVRLDSGCSISSQYCVLSAETGQTGIQFRFSESAPPQVPVDLPWSGGFVNPINGAVYDLLGRAYQFQGDVDSMTIIPLQN